MEELQNKTGHEYYNIKFNEKNDEDLFGVVTKGALNTNDVFIGISFINSQKKIYLCNKIYIILSVV